MKIYTHIPINSQELFYEALQTIPAFSHEERSSEVSFLAEGIKPPFCEHDVERYIVDCSENRVIPYSRLWLNDKETKLWHKRKGLFTITLPDNDWPDADFFFDNNLIGANVDDSKIPPGIEYCTDLVSLLGADLKIHRIDVRFKPALKEFQKSLPNDLRDNGYQINTANFIFQYSPFFTFGGQLILREEDATLNRSRVPLLENGLGFVLDRSGDCVVRAHIERLDKWFEALKKKYI